MTASKVLARIDCSERAQQQIVAEAEARGQSRQALRIHDRGAQAGQLAFIRGRVRVVEMLGGDQLEHGIAQVLEALVVRAAPFWVLVVIGAMRQRLPEQGSIVEAHAERALKLL
jgi:hypothetical protein